MQYELRNLIEHFDVISFDVFDTLLVRNVLNPKDVWRIIEQRESSREFYAERDAADVATHAVATRRGGEHTLDEAYAMMGGRWADFKRKELEAESLALFANPEMVEVWNEAGRLGKKRVIVSDMYLPRSEIEKLLHSKGISGWNEIFVSSEHGCRKTSGKLFEKMLETLAVAPERMMHVGDNRESDFEVPQRLGMTAMLYPKIKDRFLEECRLAREYLSYRTSFDKECLVGALAYGWHVFKCEHPEAMFWHKIGFLYGGVLGYAYVSWICLEARKKGIDHLMFVGRDGYIWQKIGSSSLWPATRRTLRIVVMRPSTHCRDVVFGRSSSCSESQFSRSVMNGKTGGTVAPCFCSESFRSSAERLRPTSSPRSARQSKASASENAN